jgi:mevalonate pyrophosphate decarboxylase
VASSREASGSGVAGASGFGTTIFPVRVQKIVAASSALARIRRRVSLSMALKALAAREKDWGVGVSSKSRSVLAASLRSCPPGLNSLVTASTSSLTARFIPSSSIRSWTGGVTSSTNWLPTIAIPSDHTGMGKPRQYTKRVDSPRPTISRQAKNSSVANRQPSPKPA